MCGIAGIITSSEILDIDDTAIKMAKEIRNRGPDSSGIYSDVFHQKKLAITHRRLSILDLSKKGNQPMVSKNKRFVIAFNGEIYNHKSLKRKIDNVKTTDWLGNSDTEILLESISIFGILKTLNLAIGMFSIALLDKQEDKLYLLRDRFGEKPLYYGFIGEDKKDSLVFASEIHALKKNPYFQIDLNETAIDYFLRMSYVPTPLSIYKNVYKVKPASMVIFNLKEDFFNKAPEIIDWWSYIDLMKRNSNNKYDNEGEAIIALDNALNESIKDQSISDVPLGCFLSAGIDSSTIASKLQTQSKKKVKTFTIGSFNKEFDESKYAKEIANYLGTEHYEYILSPNDILNIIDDLPKIYSEPFADASQIPTAIICREIKRKGITVALSGDGGDEIFGGYVRHYTVDNLWKKINLIPFSIRKSIGFALNSLPSQFWNSINISKNKNFTKRFMKFTQCLKTIKSNESLYKLFVIDDPYNSLYTDNFNFLLGKNTIKNSFEQELFPNLGNSNEISFVDKMLIWDALLYLTDDVLVKVDRASMHFSLETRAPFLDKRLVEVSSQIPYTMKVKKNYGKHILRKLIYKYIPQELLDRPKSGFSIPLGNWLRKDLRNWAEGILFHKDEYINQKKLEHIWEQHLSSKYDNSIILWRVIMLKAWLIENNY